MDGITTINELAGGGTMAERLMAGGMHVNALRPFVWPEDGKSYISIPGKDGKLVANRITANATLRYDEWKEIDRVVTQAAVTRLVGVGHLQSRPPLVKSLTNGLGTMVLQSQKASDMTAAQMSMAGDTPGTEDRLDFGTDTLPLPIFHKDFRIPIRLLESSRRLGMPLDTDMAAVAGRKVAELVESTLFMGSGDYTFGGGKIDGYVTHDSANTVSIGTHWNDSGATGATILATVLDMKQASVSDHHFGPWGLYVPTAYEHMLDEDFKANSDLTIRQRLLEIEGLEFVAVADQLTGDRVLLVELQPETVRLINGLDFTTVQWESAGGMMLHFKVIAIKVPQIRASYGGESGIVIAS